MTFLVYKGRECYVEQGDDIA